MDWGFLDIFKKADFNVLMVAAAGTAWILHFKVDTENVWFFAAAVLCSLYCAIKLIIKIYLFLSDIYKDNKDNETHELLQKQENEKNVKELYAEALRIYTGLSDNSKAILQDIYVKGKQDPLKAHCRLISKLEFMLVIDAQHVAETFLSVLPISFGKQRIWFELVEQPDSYLAIFDPYLHNIIGKNISNKNNIK